MMNGDDARASGAGSYASVNGLEMYYEVHGAGQPLVLLHGALSAIGASFGKVLPYLGTEPIELERTRVIEAPGVTHLTFRVVKED
jgi:pimeloyl-ACP methyl ester carboxylesterase